MLDRGPATTAAEFAPSSPGRPLEELHAKSPLDVDVLVNRFQAEMTHVIGDLGKIRGRFLDLVERLFGEMKRVTADKATRPPAT